MLWSLAYKRSTAWLSLTIILCVFTTVIDSYDLSQRRQPQGPLGVALDFSFATSFPVGLDANPQPRRNWMFSSHLTFAQPVNTITDGQLWQIARDAYAEIEPERLQYRISDRGQANAMTVLAFGHELILASSQKGPTSFSYTFQDTRVLETLRICQAAYMITSSTGSNLKHRTDGRCGEVMAAHLYYTLYETPFLPAQHARVATVVNDGDQNLGPRDPCGNPSRVGSSQSLPGVSRLCS